jgi:hypothetical protein
VVLRCDIAIWSFQFRMTNEARAAQSVFCQAERSGGLAGRSGQPTTFQRRVLRA